MAGPELVLITGLPGVGKTTLANDLASELGASVLGHDVVMAGLRGYPTVWHAMEELEWLEFRTVGWSVMWNLARAQLVEGRSVVLDGVARSPEVTKSRDLARSSGARSFVVLCALDDVSAHQSRIEGRTRNIPNWPELKWEDVERSRSNWEPPEDVDLHVDTSGPTESAVRAILSVCHS